MIIFGTIGIFVKIMGLPSGIVSLFRGVLGTAFLALAFLTKKMDKEIKTGKGNTPALVLSGILIGLNWILLFESYKYITVSAATVCYYLAPIFVIIISPFAFKERLNFKKILCVIAAFAGIILISGFIQNSSESKALSGHNYVGILLAAGAALLYACVIVINKKTPGENPVKKTTTQLASTVIAVLPYTVLFGEWKSASFNFSNTALLLIVGIIHTGAAYYLYFKSITKIKAQTAAIFSYIDPVSAVILSSIVLNEKMDLLSIVGAVMVIASAMISEINFGSKKTEE